MPMFLDRDPYDKPSRSYSPPPPTETDLADKLLSKTIAEISEQKKVPEPDDKYFIQKMIHYLEKKQFLIIFHCNLKDVSYRVEFISTLVRLILLEDLAAQIGALSEEKISPFKGYFTQELYNLLKTRRLSFTEKELLIQKLTSIPTPVVSIVAEYVHIRFIGSTKNKKVADFGENTIDHCFKGPGVNPT
jgi:hypothetical protein